MQIHVGDCREVLRTLPESGVDAIVTDPPYELGFMGKGWDSSGIAYDVGMWREVLRVLKPGAHLLAFGGSRTYHRLACAIEDSGFDIRDQIMWIYGSGFPKSHNLDGDWDGWGTALKPAHEPIVVARKPLTGTVAANILAHGTGALNINSCRIQAEGRPAREVAPMRNDVEYRGNSLIGRVNGTLQSSKAVGSTNLGRWPANIIHDGSDEVVALFPREAGAAAPVHRRNADKFRNAYGSFAGDIDEAGSTFHGDTGSAARFFYCAKAGRDDRDDGLDGVQARKQDESRKAGNPGGDNPRNRGVHERKNFHPTVKPLDLMRYLCRLVTPPGGGNPRPLHGLGLNGPRCSARAIPVHRHRNLASVCGHRAPADPVHCAAIVCGGVNE